MALSEITNRVEVAGSYTVNVSLAPRFSPLIKRGRPLHEQVPKREFCAYRSRGATNIDLWVDGEIYPRDPRTGVPPTFRTIKQCLEFICLGEEGLLGFCKTLANFGSGLEGANVALEETIRNYQVQMNLLNNTVSVLHAQLQEAKGQLRSALDSIRGQCLQHQTVIEEGREIERQCGELREKVVGFGNRNKELEELVRTLMEASTAGRVNELEVEVAHYKQKMMAAESRLSVLKEGPLGARLRSRHSRGLDELTQDGGQAKRRRKQLRSMLQPQAVDSILKLNKACRGQRRLWGSDTTQRKTAVALARILSKREALALVEEPRMRSVGSSIANTVLKKIGAEIGADSMLAACDMAGVPQEAYGLVFKTMKRRVKLVDPALTAELLPKPHKVALLRRELNANLPQFIGEYKHIEGRFTPPLPARSSGKAVPIKEVQLDDKNSLFVDLEAVQRSMVLFYQITEEELRGKPLIFVLKLDEAEIMKGKKFERVSLTLMNRVLDPEIQMDSSKFFSVQSEQEIWPVGCFQVLKESYPVLKWVFDRTNFPSLIQAQEDGQVLTVDGVGDFQVEWHLSADMKTIKCMYGLGHGANAAYSCIYCMQQRMKPQQGSNQSAIQASRARMKHTWEGGLFGGAVSAKPVDMEEHSRWKPILPIPLTRVHICTLHAQVRMCEKIIHLHFMFVWNMHSEAQKTLAIQQMEKSLSAVGAHGGNVEIAVDPQRSGKSNSVPQKPSINGVVASRLFQASTWSGKDKAWMDICQSEHNCLTNGGSRITKLEMWQAFEKLQPYLTGLTLTLEQRSTFKEKVEAWGKLYIKAFGEEHVTHYMHNIVKHAPYFVETYGSLSVWNCQGMEKSHYAAKAANQRHTQHGGGRARKSCILQQYEHWYRNIQHRYTAKLQMELLANDVIPEPGDGSSQLERRRAASNNSNASVEHQKWRDTRVRSGSVYIAREPMGGD